ncbi:DUF1996 domain-containing protein [Subtercola lobariae]|uniref:DUF1996 domain-containing protein n=1 Tax=Subtercola lobariae TaxID=1588641 RepID=A0A917B2V3_9MICO|nr:DUF1996 domain-containing protein [Subtercola lobariae]GGF16466.1 hypothetical protein GCM10011399_07810 [Subtercola lobariae]
MEKVVFSRKFVLVGAIVAVALVAVGSGAGVALAVGVLGHPAASAAAPSATSGPGASSVNTAGFPTGKTGIFTDTCGTSLRAPNDPIMMPGMTGMSMQHDFFGNSSPTASSVPAQLVGGSTTCSTSADSSAYWTPVVYQNGVALTPSKALIYWRAPAATAKSVQTIPVGLTMIAGNENATVPQDDSIVNWTCSTPSDATAKTTVEKPSDAPHDCPAGQSIRLVISFPNCWDGTTLDGHTQQNVVYAGAKMQSASATCPSSHPVQIPQVVVHVNYPTSSATGLTLSTGPTSQGPMVTGHADFMSGWNQKVLTADVAACVDAATQCGPVSGAAATPRGGVVRSN